MAWLFDMLASLLDSNTATAVEMKAAALPMKYDHEYFAKVIRQSYGKFSASQWIGLEFLLSQLENDTRITDKRQHAYMLATVKHETAHTYQPIEEYGKGKGRRYGAPDLTTGQTYYGRGYVQLTWKRNYETMTRLLKIDLVNKPELALDPHNAYQIMSLGMHDGFFTGKCLDQYINNKVTDYINARRIINGTDKAAAVAKIARVFESALKEL